MTLKTSLAKKPARYAFLSSFNILPILINILFFLVYISVSPNNSGDIERMIASAPDTQYFFYFFVPSADIMFFLLLSQAMANAVYMFSFMHSKRASFAYLSAPVKRGALFLSKYFAGAIMTVLPSIINLLLRLNVNLKVFGCSTLLIQAFLVLSLGMIVCLLTVYSITTAVCLCVGTVIEGIAFSFILIFSPLLLTQAVNSICLIFLWGNEFGEHIYFGQKFISPSLSYYFQKYTPALSYVPIFDNLSELNTDSYLFNRISEYLSACALSTALWFAFSLLVSVFAYVALKRFKAENSGMHGTNKYLNTICTFTLVFFIFGMYYDSYTSIAEKVIFDLLRSLLLFLLCRFLLTLNIRKTFSKISFLQFGIMLVVICIPCILCLTGLFGYSAFQPELNEIENVTVTYTGAPDFISGGEGISSTYYNKYRVHIRDFEDLIYTSEDSENDIQTILELHKKIINAGPEIFARRNQIVEDVKKDWLSLQIYVSYKLKNGRYVDRVYKTVPAQIAKDLLVLDEAKAVKERIGGTLDITKEEIENLPVKVTNSLFGNEITLNETERLELFNAIKMDIESLTLNEKYFPGKQALAVVYFFREDSKPVFEGYSITGSDNNLTVTYNNEPDYYGASTETVRYYITDGYENTLAYLKEKGIYGAINAETLALGNITGMFTERYLLNYTNETQALYFRSYQSAGYPKLENALEINTSEYGSILELTRNNYYVAEGGYLIRVLINDGTEKCVTLFLPESDAPDYVKKGVVNR